MKKSKTSARAAVPENLPPDLPEGERRAARMRVVAGRRLRGITVVLDGVHDPHNISAVLRSCDGFGVQRVHLIGKPDALPINRLITRGCEKWLHLRYYDAASECVAALRKDGFELWAAVPDRKAPALEDIDFARRIALLFGAERDGLSDELLSACDGRYQIPMPGFSQSLNISVAAAISVYVATTSRRRALNRPSDLAPREIETLVQAWIDQDNARRRGHISPDSGGQ